MFDLVLGGTHPGTPWDRRGVGLDESPHLGTKGLKVLTHTVFHTFLTPARLVLGLLTECRRHTPCRAVAQPVRTAYQHRIGLRTAQQQMGWMLPCEADPAVDLNGRLRGEDAGVECGGGS